MSDQAGVGVDSVPQATAYAIRAWYTSVLGQTRAVRQDLASKVEAMELEVQQVTAQIERADTSIASLEHVLETVDDWIRRLSHGEGQPNATGARSRSRRREATAELEDETAGEGAQPTRSTRSKGRS
jgi:phage shock protein A